MDELVSCCGKTVLNVSVAQNDVPGGDAQLRIDFTDGTKLTVAAVATIYGTGKLEFTVE
jgi:hypothetical protein